MRRQNRGFFTLISAVQNAIQFREFMPSVLFLLALWATFPAVAQINVLTVNYDNARTNANLNETVLSTLNVNPAQFGKLFSLPVTGYISAQPLYLQGVAIPNHGTHNVVYVATMHNDVYAFDADKEGPALWHVNLGPTVPGTEYHLDPDYNEVGILGTPVIDASRHAIYVVAHTKEDAGNYYRLHALDTRTGSEKFGGPALIQATAPGTWSLDSHNGQIAFAGDQHLQRPGLLLLNNVIYIGFGSHADIGLWHGWLIGYNAAAIQQQTSVLLVTPDGYGAGIWQAGRGAAADSQGNIYFATGNGNWYPFQDFGESFVKASTSSGAPAIVDWFTPDIWSSLNDKDFDLGSCGPVLTASGQMIGGGKSGIVYLLDVNNMGHEASGNGQVTQTFQAIGFGIFNMAYWERYPNPMLYLRAKNDAVKAFQLVNGKFTTTPVTQGGFTAGMLFDGMAISANGSQDYSGIFWITTTANGNQNDTGVLHALSAVNLSQELWNSNMNAARDGLGLLAKYIAPTVANGKVYVATFANALQVYGLLVQKQMIASVVNAASSAGGAVAPGEMVVVYGSQLGPSKLAGATVDSTGHLSSSISGAQILFNNTPAPLIYARTDQVAAIVPNAVAGQTSVSVQAQYQNQTTAAFTTAVVDTTPGIFTLDQTGHGQGAILNQDGSLNQAANPAARGSVVVLWATGQGLSDPDWAEDALATDPLPKPVKPVEVNIDAQPAHILYAGAAPGLAGIIQINVEVPFGIQPGSAVPVTVKIGANVSQPGVTVAIH